MVPQRVFQYFYPDDSHDGTSQFYGWIREYLGPHTCLLNLGAGPATRNPKRIFQGQVARVVGADVDPIVLENPELDHACVIVDGRLPLDDETFDLVVSDFVLEHVERPAEFLAEAHRVLRPGGSLFFRTPNKHHYVALISQLTPHWFHTLVANRVRNLPADTHEPWRTHYLLNTPGDIRRAAQSAGFVDCELRMCEAEPSYLVFNTLPFLAGVAYERFVNRFSAMARARASIFGRLQR